MLRNVSVIALSALLACGKSEKPPSSEGGTDAARRMTESQETPKALDHYRVAPAQQLSLSLRAREAEPKGQLSGIQGELWVDTRDLSRSHGFLEFDLTTLAILTDGGEPSPERTLMARRWLGPWTQARDSIARLEITSLAQVSALHFDDGDRILDEHGRAGKRVRATLIARLTIRRAMTDHRIPVIAELFAGADADGQELRVRLLPGDSISLLEHEIIPRDDQGVAIAPDRALLGRVVGTRARVSGEVRWISGP